MGQGPSDGKVVTTSTTMVFTGPWGIDQILCSITNPEGYGRGGSISVFIETDETEGRRQKMQYLRRRRPNSIPREMEPGIPAYLVVSRKFPE